MKFAKIAACAAALSLSLAGCSGGASASGTPGESYNWDFTITVGNTTTWHLGAEKFAEILDEESDGRIKVNVFTNEQLSGGDAGAGIEQLMNGDKAFSYNSTITYSGIDPRFSAINAPFLYKDYAEADAAIAGGALDAYKKVAEENNIELLGFGESGFRQITNNKHPVIEPDDLKSLKLRVPGSGLFMDIYSTLGADPITMNFSEVFTSLQNNTIDGQENPYDVIYSNGLTEVQEHLTVWNYVYDPLVLGMNKDLYDSLSEEDQVLVQKAAAEANKIQITENRKREAEQLAEMRKKMQVAELDSAQVDEFRKAMSPIYEKYATIWTEELAKAVKPQ